MMNRIFVPAPSAPISRAQWLIGVFASKSLNSRLCQICVTVAVGEAGNQRVTSGLRMRQASQVTVLADNVKFGRCDFEPGGRGGGGGASPDRRANVFERGPGKSAPYF